MTPLWVPLLALVLISVESGLAGPLGLAGTRLDLSPALLAWLGLRVPGLRGLLAAYLVGYIQGVLFGGPLGMYPLTTCTVYFAVRFFTAMVALPERPALGLTCMAAVWLWGTLAILLDWLVAPPGTSSWQAFRGLPLQGLLTGALAFLAHPLLARLGLLGSRLDARSL